MALRESLRLKLRVGLGSRPKLFFPASKWRQGGPGRVLVDRETEIVIEGFPRSGNTFAQVAFEAAQERPVKVAHHYHMPAQVIRGVEYGIPALVLIRDPLDAVASFLVRHDGLAPIEAIRYYKSFYRDLLPYRENFVLADFPRIVTDFGAIIREVNEKFGSAFGEFEHSEENVAKSFSRIDELDRADKSQQQTDETSVARPSDLRKSLKAEIVAALNRGRAADLLQEARQLHHNLAGSA